MQRRAAAVYAVFFLVLAVGAYAALSVAQEPAISVEGENFSPGQNVTFGDQTYTVGNISGGSSGGEGGGSSGGEGGGSGPTSELTRVNESARFTTTLENNSTLVFREGAYRPAGEGEGDSGGGGSSGTTDNGTGASGTANGTTTSGGNATGTASANANASTNGTSTNGTSTNGTSENDSAARTFRVLVPNATEASAVGGSGETDESNTTTVGGGNTSGSGNASGGSGGANVTTVTLREEFNASVLARQDPAVEDSILTAPNGTRYVRYASNGTTQPVEEFLPEPEVRNVSVGDSFPYKNNSTTIEAIESGSVTLAWTSPEVITEELEEGTNVTLGGQELVAHFPDDGTLVLSRNVATYQEEVRAVEDYNERLAGFWGIIIISGLTVVLLVGMAYLPVRG
jgi:hypothetical protein